MSFIKSPIQTIFSSPCLMLTSPCLSLKSPGSLHAQSLIVPKHLFLVGWWCFNFSPKTEGLVSTQSPKSHHFQEPLQDSLRCAHIRLRLGGELGMEPFNILCRKIIRNWKRFSNVRWPKQTIGKNAVFRHFATFLRTWIFFLLALSPDFFFWLFLLTLSSDSFSSLIFSLLLFSSLFSCLLFSCLLLSSLLFSSLTLPTSAFPSVNIVASLTSKLPGPGGSKSRLAKAVGAEQSGQMRNEKLHAVVVKTTFRSQNVQNTSASEHFWKLR